MGNARQRSDIRHIEPRIADGLDVQETRALRDRRLKSLWAVPRRIAGPDAIMREVAEEGTRTAVKTARRHELIAFLQHIEHSLRDCRHARGTGDSTSAALQLIDAALKAHERRVTDARVDEPRLAPRKHLRHILRRLLIERRRLINRLRRRSRRLIRSKAAVQQACRESHENRSYPIQKEKAPGSMTGHKTPCTDP